MIKFVIGIISLIFVGLAVYVYTGKKSEELTKSAVTYNGIDEKVMEKELVSVVKEVTIKTKAVVKKNTVKNLTIMRNKKQMEENFFEDDPLPENGKIVNIEEESPEKIMQFEIESGLTDGEAVDNTPLETGKIEL